MTRMPFALGAVVAALVLTGCGGGDDDAADATPAATTPAAAVTTDAATVDAGGGVGSCEVPDEVKAAVTDSHVTSIEVNGGCQMVSIGTTLTKADYQTAQQICETASKAAYAARDDLMSVNVEGPDGHELAVGLKGASCIGEP